MLKISDLKIDPACLGSKFLLVDVSAVHEYKNGMRTGEISGYKYCVVLPDKKMEQLSVKICGPQLMDVPDSYVEVSFDGLEVLVYVINGNVQIVGRAMGIRPAKVPSKS